MARARMGSLIASLVLGWSTTALLRAAPPRRSDAGYSGRSGGIGIGTSNTAAATPMPPSHVFGGTVPT